MGKVAVSEGYPTSSFTILDQEISKFHVLVQERRNLKLQSCGRVGRVSSMMWWRAVSSLQQEMKYIF